MFARRTRDSTLALSTVLLLAGCRAAPPPEPRSTPPEDAPRLVLFLIVDQGRADYFERFRPLFRHGLDRLLRESAVFVETHHELASTQTAPGHATLATGEHPSRHGIVANQWYRRETGEYLYSDDDDRWDEEKSPFNLLVPTLADRIKERWPESKAYGASAKSRGAILPPGRQADRAFWYERDDGRIVTSTYYGEVPPAWLDEFNRNPLPDRFYGGAWEPLPESVAASEGGYGIEPLDRGLVYPSLPKALGRASTHPDRFYYERYYRTPFVDRYIFELARTILIEEELGADAFPDFLSISFSATDIVGHDYGPDSIEVLDTLLRLDRTLGDLLDLVDERIGLEQTVITLSADHGVVPVPEIARGRGESGRRFGMEERTCVQTLDSKLDREFSPQDWFVSHLVFDPEAIAASGSSRAEVEQAARRILERCPGIERIWTSTELTGPESDDPMHRLYRNNYHPDRTSDLGMQVEAGSVARTDNTATHGSPYPYDTRVPWLLRARSGEGTTIFEPARTVDVAPTLAALIGVEMPPDVEGVDRSGEVVRP